MIFTFLCLFLLFLVIGFIITPGNAKNILNGYKELSEEEREKVDIVAFLRFHKRFHIVFSSLFLLLGLLALYFKSDLAASLVLGIVPLAAYFYYILKSKDYFKNVKSSKAALWVSLILLSITTFMVLFLMIYGNKENQWVIEGEQLRISGMYGETISIENIEKIKLVDSLPKIKMKSNGFAVGDIRKGYFKLDNGKKVKLLWDRKAKPILCILKKDSTEIYYTSPQQDTESLFYHLETFVKLPK